MANPTVAIDITARLDGLKAELAKMEGLGQQAAKQLTGALAKDIRANTQALKGQTAEAARAAQATGKLGDSGNRALKALGPLGGVISKLSPDLGAASSAMAGLTSAFEGFEAAGVAAAGAVAVLGGLAAAYQAVTGEIERDKAATDALRAAHESLIPFERTLRDTQVDLSVALGLTTKAMAEQEKASNSARDAVEDFAKGQQKQRDELRKSTESAQMWLGVIDKDSIVGGMVDAVAGWSDTIEENTRIQGGLDRALAEQRDLVKANREATQDLALAKDAEAAATRGQAKAEESFNDQVEALRAKVAKREEDRRAAMQAQFVSDSQEMALIWQHEEEERTKTTEEEAKKRAEAERKAAEEAQRIWAAQVTSYGDIAGAISSIASSLGDNLTEEQKQTAMALFAIQKGAAMAQAAINTVLAVSEASTAAPYPANLALMAGAAAVGVAQEVAIAAEPPPSFGDTPAPMQMQSGGNVRLAGGDYFAAAQSPERLARQVGAIDPYADRRTGGPTVAIVGSRAFGQTVKDDVARGGSLARLLGSTRSGPLGVRR